MDGLSNTRIFHVDFIPTDLLLTSDDYFLFVSLFFSFSKGQAQSPLNTPLCGLRENVLIWRPTTTIPTDIINLRMTDNV